LTSKRQSWKKLTLAQNKRKSSLTKNLSWKNLPTAKNSVTSIFLPVKTWLIRWRIVFQPAVFRNHAGKKKQQILYVKAHSLKDSSKQKECMMRSWWTELPVEALLLSSKQRLKDR
jgi:hypothetical protein